MDPITLISMPCLICGTEMGDHLIDAANGHTDSGCPLGQALVQEAANLGQPDQPARVASIRIDDEGNATIITNDD